MIDTMLASQLKINLKCDTCDNIYNKKISYYIKKQIPFCKICHIPYEKSFASHDKAKYWSDKNELKPFQVYLSTHTKFLFDCPCGHEILMSPNDITDNHWCGYCSVPVKHLCDCNTCYNKTFASHDKSKYWSEKNTVPPNIALLGSEEKYYLDCPVCFHTFDSAICDMVSKDSWCPYCCIPTQKICDDLNYYRIGWSTTILNKSCLGEDQKNNKKEIYIK